MFGRADIRFQFPAGAKKAFFVFLGVALMIAVLWYAVDYFHKEKSLPERVAQIVAGGRIDDCEKIHGRIDGVDYKTVCKNNVALKTALDNLDFGACGLLDGKLVTRESCEFEVLQKKISQKHSSTICDEVPSRLKKACLDRYWFEEAVVGGGPELCKKMVSEEAIGQCQKELLFVLAAQSPEKFSCTSFQKNLQSDCSLLKNILAAKLPDIAECGRLSSLDLKELCFYHLRQRTFP